MDTQHLNALGRVSEELSGGMDEDSGKARRVEEDDSDAFEDSGEKEWRRKQKEEEKFDRYNSLTDLFFN